MERAVAAVPFVIRIEALSGGGRGTSLKSAYSRPDMRSRYAGATGLCSAPRRDGPDWEKEREVQGALSARVAEGLSKSYEAAWKRIPPLNPCRRRDAHPV